MQRNETLDESIAEELQTMDLLCFSSQVLHSTYHYIHLVTTRARGYVLTSAIACSKASRSSYRYTL
jgi:hypothetical protein